MKTFLINASLPGCGKTYLLAKLFKEYQLHQNEHAVFIAKTNKAIDNAKNMLNGERLGKGKTFKTLDQFLENWKIISYEDNEEHLVHIKTEPHISRTYWTIFIDEVSMLSKININDITANFRVANIIAAGDVAQHKPIASTYYEKSAKTNVEYVDEGDPIPISFWDKTYILNEPFRFKDQKLVELLNIIKKQDIITSNCLEEYIDFCKSYKPDGNDLHICYTNKKVDEVNGIYEGKISRYMVNRKWKLQLDENFDKILQNGQFIDADFYNMFCENVGNLFSPAMAVTSHKLQGWTAQAGHKIYIHLADFENVDKHCSELEKDLTFMQSLWVALTRAPQLSQISFIDVTPEKAASIINKHIKSGWVPKLNGINIKQDACYNDILNELNDTVEDKSDPRFNKFIEKYGEAHKVQHKQHKQHKLETLDVQQIKKMYQDGASQRSLATLFGVSRTVIKKALDK